MGLFDLFIKKEQQVPNILDISIDMHLKEAEVDIVAIVKNSHVMYINEHLDRLFINSSRGKFEGRVAKFNFKGMEDKSSIEIFIAFDEQDAYTMFTMNMNRDGRFEYISQALMTYFQEKGITSVFANNVRYATQQEYAFKLFKEESGYFMINNSRTKTYTVDWDGVTEG